MKTIEVHEFQGDYVYVQKVVVRQQWLPDGGNPFGKPRYEIDLLGARHPKYGPEPPKQEEHRAVRITITSNGDDFTVNVNPSITEIARRL